LHTGYTSDRNGFDFADATDAAAFCSKVNSSFSLGSAGGLLRLSEERFNGSPDSLFCRNFGDLRHFQLAG
jgi:hypothetical protein